MDTTHKLNWKVLLAFTVIAIIVVLLLGSVVFLFSQALKMSGGIVKTALEIYPLIIIGILLGVYKIVKDRINDHNQFKKINKEQF